MKPYVLVSILTSTSLFGIRWQCSKKSTGNLRNPSLRLKVDTLVIEYAFKQASGDDGLNCGCSQNMILSEAPVRCMRRLPSSHSKIMVVRC